MMKYFLILLVLFFTQIACAQDERPVALEKAPVNIRDYDSIKRGAKFFSTNCMVCHTMVYMRYNKIAEDAGVLYERMPLHTTTWPFGVKPPDLSLEASRRGVDWIYTYLHSFYVDPHRPTGVNDLLVPNTAMPGIIMAYQGQQTLVPENQLSKNIYGGDYQWYDLVELQTQGSMTPEQFDATITDVVNFLQYASEPYKVQQESIGVWVIGYFLIMFILMYLLKRAYWKNLRLRRK